jgi:hypothetical protein
VAEGRAQEGGRFLQQKVRILINNSYDCPQPYLDQGASICDDFIAV